MTRVNPRPTRVMDMYTVEFCAKYIHAAVGMGVYMYSNIANNRIYTLTPNAAALFTWLHFAEVRALRRLPRPPWD